MLSTRRIGSISFVGMCCSLRAVAVAVTMAAAMERLSFDGNDAGQHVRTGRSIMAGGESNSSNRVRRPDPHG